MVKFGKGRVKVKHVFLQQQALCCTSVMFMDVLLPRTRCGVLQREHWF